MFKKLIKLFFIISVVLYSQVSFSGHGSEEEVVDESTLEPEIGYYTFTPDLTTNVATLNPREKIHYVRLKLSLMLEDSRDSAIIADVEPVIKDIVIDILGAKEYGQVATNEAREKIRIECREKIVELLKEKFGKPIVIDVLFLNYMYQ